jgi:hypothetical protein
MNQEIKSIRLLYEDPTTGMLCIVHPTGETSLEYIIENAIPKDSLYWQIDESDIPEDRSFRDAWELDTEALGKPDGVGGAQL